MSEQAKWTPTFSLKDALLGGPGLDGYTFNAAVYCIECGQEIIHNLPKNEWDEYEFQDSEVVPQPIFFGESPDYPEHCNNCGVFLYGEKEAAE